MKYILAFCLLLVLSPDTIAANFTVNSISQLQSALNTASSNGQNDTINILAGTYNVNPTLTYSSNENYSIFIRGVSSPVFEGSNLRQIMQMSSLAVNGDIFIEGLVIQHGRADYGGGLNISTQGADISVNNCAVNDNIAGFVAGGVNLFSNTGNITVTNCSFRRNSSPNTSGYPYGTAGGLFIQTDGANTVVRLTGCIFELNTAQRDAAGAMLYPLGAGSTVIAESNTFINNTAKEAGGGCWIRGPGGNTTVRYRNNTLTGNSSSIAGSGGGTYIQIASGSITLFDNLHSGNHSVWQGGGLWIEHGGGTMKIFRNRFTNNTSGESGGAANVFLDNGTAKLYHNIFNRNVSTGPGGGLNLSTSTGKVIIFNSTFYSNRSPDGGDVNFYFDNSSSSASFVNNILYNSTIPALSYSGSQTVVARYSDIKGGAGEPWFGTGCIDRYPFFRDTTGGDFHLQDSIQCSGLRYSPCIDAGDPAVRDSILACNWGLGLLRSDMGTYGGRDSNTIGINNLQTGIPKEYKLCQNYPNPFNPVTKIQFAIPLLSLPLSGGDREGVSLRVYDIIGREVAVLVNEQLSPGTYEVDFDGSNLPSGVYCYRLEVNTPRSGKSEHPSGEGNFAATKKMVLIK